MMTSAALQRVFASSSPGFNPTRSRSSSGGAEAVRQRGFYAFPTKQASNPQSRIYRIKHKGCEIC
jgi:hypothetical protein